MHTLSDKVRFVQRKLKPEEVFTTKEKWKIYFLTKEKYYAFGTGSYTFFIFFTTLTPESAPRK